jgi:RNA polymerase sigma-70 factor (ECF subfamily)
LHAEDEIKRLIAADDAGAMRVVFDGYYKILCICAMRYVTDIADAEDIVQDVLSVFWTNKRGKIFTGSVRAYLLTAVSRAALKYVSRRRTIRLDDVESFVDMQFEKLLDQTDGQREALRRRLELEIGKLPERSREVFNLVVTTGMSYGEVGRRMGITVNTVKTLYYHAVKKLRENVKDDRLFILMIAASLL